MNCNCKYLEIVLGALILIFAFWQTSYSQWVIVIAAALLIIHAFTCKNCGGGMCASCATPMKSKSSKKKRK